MAETVLAFDYGASRIGVAVGNTLLREATPLAIVRNLNREQSFTEVASLLSNWQPRRLVVGVPHQPDGSASAMTLRCERFARQLEGRFGIQVRLVDETFSSLEAAARLREVRSHGLARSRRNTDDLAAAVILQRYFDELDTSPA